MNGIVAHIEYLLLRHGRVIVPGLGGFVFQSVPAVYKDEEHSFAPSHKEITFNETLTHNDELLAESYMKINQVDLNKARQLMEADIAEMKATLDEEGEVQFGSIGYLMKNDSRIVFMPTAKSTNTLNYLSYGLPVFHFISLPARKSSINTATTSTALVPLKVADTEGSKQGKRNSATRTFVHLAAAVAAAIALFLLISTPVKEVNRASYTASFVPRDIVAYKTADEVVSDAFSDASGYVSEPGELSENTETIAAQPSLKPGEEARPKAAAEKPEPETTTPAANHAKYYVIIGSFDTRRRANIYIKRLKDTETAASKIVVSDGHVRVYAGCFDNEASANAYLQKLRQNPKHKEAWMYKGK